MKQAFFAYVNHARIRSWNQPVLSKVSCSRKQRGPLMGLELTTDKYPPITSQTRYPLRHAASKINILKAYIPFVEKSSILRSLWSIKCMLWIGCCIIGQWYIKIYPPTDVQPTQVYLPTVVWSPRRRMRAVRNLTVLNHRPPLHLVHSLPLPLIQV